MPDIGVDLVKVLSTTQQMVLPQNPRRSMALFINDSDAICYLALGKEAVVNRGIRLNASGGAYEINATNLWKGSVHAVSVGATKDLTIVEW